MDCFCNDIEFRYERAFPDIDRPYYTVQEELDEFQFGNSDFLMDICVLAYNHLDDKTALCVQKILQYTKDIKFHLILVDNGSTDGTLEYFRNLDYPFKTIVHFSENTLPTYPESNIHHYCKGKYVVRMGNDVIVTPNWYQSLLGAMERDPRCGVTIPCITNSAFFQAPKISDFSTLDELESIASAFNHTDPMLWEERLAILPSLCMIRRSCLERIGGFWDPTLVAYNDIDFSVRVRHAGYKLIICKDTMVHHNHIYTAENTLNDSEHSLNSAKFSTKHPGIHPWNDYTNFEPMLTALASQAPCPQQSDLLGVEVKCGVPLLELYNQLKGKGTVINSLSAYTTLGKYVSELSTICQDSVCCGPLDQIYSSFSGKKFSHILVGEPINLYTDPLAVLQSLYRLLKPTGKLVFKLYNFANAFALLACFGARVRQDLALYGRLVTFGQILDLFERLGAELVQVETTKWDPNNEVVSVCENLIQAMPLIGKREIALDMVSTTQYIFCVEKGQV